MVDKFLRLRDFTDMFWLPVHRPSPLLVAREAAGKYLSAVFLLWVFRHSEDRPRLSPAAREEAMFRRLTDKFRSPRASPGSAGKCLFPRR